MLIKDIHIVLTVLFLNRIQPDHENENCSHLLGIDTSSNGGGRGREGVGQCFIYTIDSIDH